MRFGPRFTFALIGAVLAAGLAGDAGAGRFAGVRKYDEVPMDVVSESFESFEEAKILPYWSVDGGAKHRLVTTRVTDGRQALEVTFPNAKGVLKYRRAGLDGFGGGVARALEVLGARFVFADRFVFDAFNTGDKPVRLVVTFASRPFPFVLQPGANSVAISTEDIAAAVYRLTQATNSIAFSIEGDKPATLIFDAMRLERESTGQAMKKFAKCFDFGPDDMAHPGFLPVDARTAFDERRGYGWAAPNLQDEKNRLQTVRSSGAEALDDLLRNGVANLSSPFVVSVAPGKYRVHMVCGANWSGIYGPSACDYDFVIKSKGEVRYARPRAADQPERVLAYYGRDRVDYEFDEDLWAKFAAETYAPIQFDVDVPDGRLDIEFQTSPQPDRGIINFLIVYPVDQAASVEPEVKRLWYGIVRRFNRVSYRPIDPGVAVDLRKPDLHEEFLNPKRRAEKIQALAEKPENARKDMVLFARDPFEQVYPDSVPEAKDCSETIVTTGTPGETIAAAVNVFALRELKDLRVEVSALEGPRGRIVPADAVDARFVRYSRRMTAPRAAGEWQYQVVPWYFVKADMVAVDRFMSVRYVLSVKLPGDLAAGIYTGTIALSTAKGPAGQARLEIDVIGVKLVSPDASRFGVISYVQPFDAGDEPYGQATRSQVTSGLSRQPARNIEALYEKQHRQEIAASLEELRACGFGKLYGGDWLKDVEEANASLTEPMRYVDLNRAMRAAQKRTAGEGKRDTSILVDSQASVAYLVALESCSEAVVRSLHDEKLSVVVGWPGVTQPVVEDVGVARFTSGLFLWRTGADGLLAGPARASWGDPYNPFDGYGGERGSLLLPSSLDWPAPNPSRILAAIRDGITDYRYLLTLEKAIRVAGDAPEAKKASEFLAALRQEVPGALSDVAEASGPSTLRERADSAWTADRYRAFRRDVVSHLLAIRRALGLPEGPEAAAQDWP